MKYEIRFSGSGGQGVITASVILGAASALYDGRYVIQSQSYGPEARGGATKADVIIADKKIFYPKARTIDYLVALTQKAANKFIASVKKGGVVIVDGDFVEVPFSPTYTHFVPQFLFISLIERMHLLYPIEEKTINPALLAHGDYRLLVARHLARIFNKRLVATIDFLLWYREIAPAFQPEHRELYRARFQTLVREAIDEPTTRIAAENYTMREMVVELREAVTSSLIIEKFMEIQNALSFGSSDEVIDADRWLGVFCSVFLPPTLEDRRVNTIVRDLSIAERILTDALAAAEAEDLDRLHRQILLAGSIRPFLQDVTAWLLPLRVSLELDVFFEIMELLEHLYPDVVIPLEMRNAFRKTRQVIVDEIERTKGTGAVTISDEEITLFIDKAYSLRARDAGSM